MTDFQGMANGKVEQPHMLSRVVSPGDKALPYFISVVREAVANPMPGSNGVVTIIPYSQARQILAELRELTAYGPLISLGEQRVKDCIRVAAAVALGGAATVVFGATIVDGLAIAAGGLAANLAHILVAISELRKEMKRLRTFNDIQETPK